MLWRIILLISNKIIKKWYFDSIFSNAFLHKCYISAMYRIFTMNFSKQSLYIPLNGKLVAPYFGQMLSAFTRQAVDLLIDVYNNDKVFNSVMKHVHAPDEIYWHTIIFNSKLRCNTIQQGKEHEITPNFAWAPLHYHSYEIYCSEYTENDYDEIVASGYMFFRKVIDGKSNSLIDKIDKRRNE